MYSNTHLIFNNLDLEITLKCIKLIMFKARKEQIKSMLINKIRQTCTFRQYFGMQINNTHVAEEFGRRIREKNLNNLRQTIITH